MPPNPSSWLFQVGEIHTDILDGMIQGFNYSISPDKHKCMRPPTTSIAGVGWEELTFMVKTQRWSGQAQNPD